MWSCVYNSLLPWEEGGLCSLYVFFKPVFFRVGMRLTVDLIGTLRKERPIERRRQVKRYKPRSKPLLAERLYITIDLGYLQRRKNSTFCHGDLASREVTGGRGLRRYPNTNRTAEDTHTHTQMTDDAYCCESLTIRSPAEGQTSGSSCACAGSVGRFLGGPVEATTNYCGAV